MDSISVSNTLKLFLRDILVSFKDCFINLFIKKFQILRTMFQDVFKQIMQKILC